MKKHISDSKIRKICDLLNSIYGDWNLGNKEDPLDELMFIILTTKTSDKSFNLTYEALKKEYKTWERVRILSENDISTAIKHGGLHHQKAVLIKRILNEIYTRHNSLDLNFLKDLDDESALEYLLSLPGVGHKTAKCVLLYSLRRNVLPVDTHTYRLAYELGLVEKTYMRNEKGKLHQILEEIIPPNCRYQFHVGAVMHGREEHRSRSTLGKCKFVQLLVDKKILENPIQG